MSAPPWANKAKVCVRCKRDCSAVARVKNPQGQYMCRECYDTEALGLKGRPGRDFAADSSSAVAAPPHAPPASNGVEVAEDNSIPLEEIVNSGEGLGAHAARAAGDGTPRDIPMCAYCGMPLKDGTIICLGCGMNSTTGLFLNGKPATAAHKCVKCGYDMRGLKSPRCPECGEVNTAAKRLKHRPREQVLREEFLRPGIYIALGVVIANVIFGLHYGWTSLIGHAVWFAAGVVACSIGYLIGAMLWIGMEGSLASQGVRIVACVALADAAMWFGDLIPFTGLWLILPAIAYVAVMQDLFDMDLNDAVIVTGISAIVLFGIGILVMKFLL